MWKICSCFFVCFWPHHVACGILVPRPGIKSASLHLEAWSLNPWATREVPGKYALKSNNMSVLLSLGLSLTRGNYWSLLNLAVTWNMISLEVNFFIINSTQILTCPMIIKELKGKHDEISHGISFYHLFWIFLSGWVLAKIQKTVSRRNQGLAEKNISMLFQEGKSLYIILRRKWISLSRQKLRKALEVQCRWAADKKYRQYSISALTIKEQKTFPSFYS